MKTKFYKLFLLLLLIVSTVNVKSQVLISLLFGDQLNTPKIEFGLVGGFNQSYFLDYESSNGLTNFNLGFYFHINIKNNSYFSTGVLVKSNMGAEGMSTYPVGNPDFDSVFVDGELSTELSYFHVPLMYHYRIRNRVYLEGGFQLGLKYKAYDWFHVEGEVAEIGAKIDVKEDYQMLDAGLIGGIGYKFKKEIKSIAVGVNYYYGLASVTREPAPHVKNSAVYVYVKIPIGTGGKEKAPE